MKDSKVRFAAVLTVFMLFCAGFVFAQNSSDNKSETQASQSQSQAQNQNLTQSQIEESQFTFDGNLETPAENAPKPVNGFWVFVRMILVLGIVLAVLYFIFRLMKKTIEPGADNDPFLRKVASINVAPGKTVQVVTLIDKAYLIGVAENSVNLISEINDAELINAMNVNADRTSNQFKAKNFAEVLEMFIPKKNSAKASSEAAGENSGNSESSENSASVSAEKKSESAFDSSTENLINSIKNKKIQENGAEENSSATVTNLTNSNGDGQ